MLDAVVRSVEHGLNGLDHGGGVVRRHWCCRCAPATGTAPRAPRSATRRAPQSAHWRRRGSRRAEGRRCASRPIPHLGGNARRSRHDCRFLHHEMRHRSFMAGVLPRGSPGRWSTSVVNTPRNAPSVDSSIRTSTRAASNNGVACRAGATRPDRPGEHVLPCPCPRDDLAAKAEAAPGLVPHGPMLPLEPDRPAIRPAHLDRACTHDDLAAAGCKERVQRGGRRRNCRRPSAGDAAGKARGRGAGGPRPGSSTSLRFEGRNPRDVHRAFGNRQIVAALQVDPESAAVAE